MANQEQLELLKQGVDIWNKWRTENFAVKIDLSRANLNKADCKKANFYMANLQGIDLREADLRESDLRYSDLSEAYLRRANLSGVRLTGANLHGVFLLVANLSEADLSETNLSGAHLDGAYLHQANLNQANLTGASVSGANIEGAHLGQANLSGADLGSSDLSEADLRDAKLRDAKLKGTKLWEADLTKADLSGAKLTGSNFSRAKVYRTIFAYSDISAVKGLEHVIHGGPSTVGTDTIAKSKGKIPEAFLRGAGLSDWEIESSKLYNPELTNEEIIKIQYRIYDFRATQALQINPLFISYSHTDSAFVDKLETYLNKKGIRFWRDIHDAKAGRLETQIDRAIRQNPTVLLILSENSIKSDWVQHEVRTARDLEKDLGRDVLCPVALDDSWKSSPWPKRIMEQVMEYNILPFASWKDNTVFEQTFVKLIDGLQLFYKG